MQRRATSGISTGASAVRTAVPVAKQHPSLITLGVSLCKIQFPVTAPLLEVKVINSTESTHSKL